MLSARNRSPFTANQWQELEHQALIYKYMVSGVPIPPDLIFTIKRSLESSLSSRMFPHQPMGWGCFQAGYGRKTDPEPGRCRRTDGKKWRCSKEAYPDSKYCERHMHRGRNRSRKPVEPSSSSSNTNTTPMATSNNNNLSVSINRNSNSTIPSSVEPDFYQAHQNSSLNPFLYSQSSSSSRPQNSNTHNLFLDSGSASHIDKNYRYYSGIREGSDERSFFPEASSGSSRNLSDAYHQQLSYKSYSQSPFESLADHSNISKQQEEDNQQHCFVLGSDFKSSSTRVVPIKLEKESETQKPLHHFFGEWPPKNSDSWLDLAPTSRLHSTDS
ncbi:growth-regulating factor 5-like [Mercurialis annua]|uniref:growth-regulating factor 5-like n=1 Tax=Mercurialis annua TaxID=3986 RepID=UPI00215F35A9|nr:growth-regulating factor 5-like [Mercurialis annua]